MSEPLTPSPKDHTSADPKWSDDQFLDRLRGSTDDDANATVAQLRQHGGDLGAVNRTFVHFHALDQALPDEAPQALRDFAIRHEELCKACDVEPDAVNLGGQVFLRWAYPAAVVMLASSLPSGYSAPALSRVLTISDDLASHPYRRLLAVIQLLINVSCQGHGEREKHDDAEVSALKLRLLHAGVRQLVPIHRPDYEARFGSPVNHEDMLATIMGFSLLVIDGIKVLGFDMSEEEAEAYWALWRHFSRLMGIAPAEDWMSDAFVPRTLTDARAFYHAYQRRWFCHSPEENPDGVRLTDCNRRMMIDLIPVPLRWLGLGRAPDILMTELLGAHELERLGMKPLTGHHFDKKLLHFLLRFGHNLEEVGDDFSGLFSATILKGMVRAGMGTITFSIPDSVEALRDLAEPHRGGGHR
ncbi:MAG: oxygenase MpaB family protein [Acidobacteriota bacterium]